MAPNVVEYLDAIIGLDIGSTETRVVAVWFDGVNIQKRVIENFSDAHNALNTSAQFSSRVLVYDDGCVKYIGNRSQNKREESSVKFLPYIFVGKIERLREQYPILQRLWEERRKVGQEDFEDLLDDAFDQFMGTVLTRIKGALQTYSSGGKQIRIKTVAMTIPSQWDLNFEELYRRLFMRNFQKVFDDMPQAASDDMSIIFHTEATALAQYIFHEASHTISLGGGMPRIDEILSKPNAQCLIDCGGHNANSTLTQFHPNKDGHGVLYELGKPQGAGGGSEMWIHDLLDQLIETYRAERNDQAELPRSFYQELKRRTTSSLDMLTQGADEFIICEDPRGSSRPVLLKVEGQMCEKAFQTGFKHVKAMIEGQLKRLASIKQGWAAIDHIVTVIVSGGSSRHPEFIKWIKELCTKLSLPEPLFTTGMEIHYAPARIALGAAYASLTSESVASFAEKCAFGLQKGNVVNQGEDDEELDLEGSAHTIWYKEQGVVPVTVDATGDQAEYRIVCEPFLESYRGVLPTDQTMAQGASYDFLNIGTLPEGYKHRIEFTLDDEEQQVELKIYRVPKPLSAKLKDYARSAAIREKVLCLGPFPVHVQPGTRSLVIQQSTDEINSQIAAAMEDYCDESDDDDTLVDETYHDDSDGDDSDGDYADGDYADGDDAEQSDAEQSDADQDDAEQDDAQQDEAQQDDAEQDAAERDDAMHDAMEGVEAHGDDVDGAIDYPDDIDNEDEPSSPRPGPSSGLGHSRHDPGPSSGSRNPHSRDDSSGEDDEELDEDDDDEPRTSRRKPPKNRSFASRLRTAKHSAKKRVNKAQQQLQEAQGNLNRAQRNMERLPDRFRAAVDRQAAALNASGTANEASATYAFPSASRVSSAARSGIASKAHTARATANAFRGSKEVSGRPSSSSQTGFGVASGTRTYAFGARPALATGPPRNNIGSSSGEASSSRHLGSSSMAPGYQGNASATRKRPAPTEDDNRRPSKRTHTSAGPLGDEDDSPRRIPSHREPGRDRGTDYSARQPFAASETRRDPPARRDGRDERPSADTDYSSLRAPSRRAVGAQEFTYSNRYREQSSEAPTRNMARLNLSHDVSASGSRPLHPLQPRPPRDDNAAPRSSPAGDFGSRSQPVDRPRPGSGPLSRWTSGPSGNSQQPHGSNGWGRGNRGGYPPRSD